MCEHFKKVVAFDIVHQNQVKGGAEVKERSTRKLLLFSHLQGLKQTKCLSIKEPAATRKLSDAKLTQPFLQPEEDDASNCQITMDIL